MTNCLNGWHSTRRHTGFPPLQWSSIWTSLLLLVSAMVCHSILSDILLPCRLGSLSIPTCLIQFLSVLWMPSKEEQALYLSGLLIKKETWTEIASGCF